MCGCLFFVFRSIFFFFFGLFLFCLAFCFVFGFLFHCDLGTHSQLYTRTQHNPTQFKELYKSLSSVQPVVLDVTGLSIPDLAQKMEKLALDTLAAPLMQEPPKKLW